MLEETLSNPTYSPAEVALMLTSYVEVELPAGGASAEARFFQLFSLLCQRVFGVISPKDYKHEIGGWLARTRRWERPSTSSSSKSPSSSGHYGPIKSSQQTSIRTDPVVRLLGTVTIRTAASTTTSKDQAPLSLIEAFAKEAEHRDNVRYEFPFLGLPKSMQEDWLALIQISLGAVDNHQPSENSKCLLGTLFRVKPLAQNQLRVYQQTKVQKKDQRRPLQLNSMYGSPTQNSPATPVMATAASPNTKDKPDATPNVLLSMLEYYLLVFVRYPLAEPDTKTTTSTASSTPVNRVGSINRSPYLTSRSTEPYGESVYYELFTEYIYYYVPTRGTRGQFNGFVGLQRPSELFVRMVIGLWYEGQNQLAPTAKTCTALRERRGLNLSLDLNASFDLVKATYTSPPKQVTRCLHNLVMRVVADSSIADLSEHVHRDLKGRNLDFLCLSPTMEIMQQPFYNQIRNVFRHASIHSKDSCFYSTLSDWLAWLEPWNTQYYSNRPSVRSTVSRSSNDKVSAQGQARYVVPKSNQRSKFTPDWEAYIASNLHFYTVPFALFLRRARELDFSPSLYQKSLDTVMKVLRVYTKEVVAVINRLLEERQAVSDVPMQSLSSSKVHYVGMVKKHEKNLGVFAPPEVSLSLTSLREDMHSLLEEIHLQHLKNKEKLDFVDRAIAAIEGALGSGTQKKEERDLHDLTEKAKAIFDFPADYEVVPQKNKARSSEQSKKDDTSDRTSEGFFSGVGLARVTDGQIKCKPEEIVYVGDRMYCRPQSYEIGFLVPLLISLSESLNTRFGVDDKGQASARELPSFVPHRFNLRFMADYRNIIFLGALVMWYFRPRLVFEAAS